MYLTLQNCHDPALRLALREAKRMSESGMLSSYHCTTNYTAEGPDGLQPYRWEPKPNVSQGGRLLRKYHGEQNVAQFPGPNGKMMFHVKIPLGEHGTDHLGINPETGEIACLLCKRLSEGKEVQ